MEIPARLRETCARNAAASAWLETLPRARRGARAALVAPARRAASQARACSWVAPAERADGTAVVLKVGAPALRGRPRERRRCASGTATARCACSNSIALSERPAGRALRARRSADRDAAPARAGRGARRLAAAPVARRRPGASVPSARRHGGALGERRRRSGAAAGTIRRSMNERDCACSRSRRSSAGDSVLLATDLHASNVLAGAARAVARDRPQAVRRRSRLRCDAAPLVRLSRASLLRRPRRCDPQLRGPARS